MIGQKWIGNSWKQFGIDLYKQIDEDDIFNGAATLAFFWMLALFPATIFLLSLLPFLPIENLHQAIMEFVHQLLPQESASLFSGVIAEVTQNQRSGLLSFGLIATFWAASSGMYALMQQLNRTYGIKEARSFVKGRLVAFSMTLVFGAIIVGAFTLIVFGGYLQTFLINHVGYESVWLIFFQIFRWVIILLLLLLGIASIYYFGPNVDQEFRFITPGSVLGVLLFVLATVGFQAYITNFGNYAATYGSIGAVIILMLWLYVAGIVILIGSEINALIEHRHTEGKNPGEKVAGEGLAH